MAAKKKSAAKKATTKGRAKVGKVMHEYKHGELKSGKGGKVKSKKQAVAIGLSEARKAGAKIPAKGKAAAKKSATKKAAKKSTKKSASKKG